MIHLVYDYWRALLDAPDRAAVAIGAVRHAMEATGETWLPVECDPNDMGFVSMFDELYAMGLVRYAHVEGGGLIPKTYVRLCEGVNR